MTIRKKIFYIIIYLDEMMHKQTRTKNMMDL